jgi:putative PIN family toxin of toxin-antitoxin system
MAGPRIVIDTNVLVAALRSNQGASFRLLSLVPHGKFELNLSVPLTLEYEQAALNLVGKVPLSASDVRDIIGYLCKVAHRWPIYFLWRPLLRDPKDDMVLELAFASNSQFIVTFNARDLAQAGQFGIRVCSPKEFLDIIGESP